MSYLMIALIIFTIGLPVLGFLLATGFRIETDFEIMSDIASGVVLCIALFALSMVWPVSILVSLGYYAGVVYKARKESEKRPKL